MALSKVTDRTPESFEDQEPSFEEKLEIFDPKVNANKFWHIRVFGCFVVRHWGRHGSKGQFKVEKGSSDYDAQRQAEKLADKKRDKGYEDEASVLERVAREV